MSTTVSTVRHVVEPYDMTTTKGFGLGTTTLLANMPRPQHDHVANRPTASLIQQFPNDSDEKPVSTQLLNVTGYVCGQCASLRPVYIVTGYMWSGWVGRGSILQVALARAWARAQVGRHLLGGFTCPLS